MLGVLRGSRVLIAAAVRGGGKASVQSPNTSVVGGAFSRTSSNSCSEKPVPVTTALSNFLGGNPEISRNEAMMEVFRYILDNQLENPANKKEIRCDKKLKEIFGERDTFGLQEIQTLLSPHFLEAK